MNKVRSDLDERKGRKEMELNEFKCRTFPFEWTNPDSTSACPGLAEGGVVPL